MSKPITLLLTYFSETFTTCLFYLPYPRNNIGTLIVLGKSNRPFPSCLVFLFHSEAKCTTFHMRISCQFYLHVNETYFHMKGSAPRLDRFEKQLEDNLKVIFYTKEVINSS